MTKKEILVNLSSEETAKPMFRHYFLTLAQLRDLTLFIAWGGGGFGEFWSCHNKFTWYPLRLSRILIIPPHFSQFSIVPHPPLYTLLATTNPFSVVPEPFPSRDKIWLSICAVSICKCSIFEEATTVHRNIHILLSWSKLKLCPSSWDNANQGPREPQ